MQLIGASHSITHAIACAGLLASTAFAAINTDQTYRLVIDGGRSYCDNYLSAPSAGSYGLVTSTWSDIYEQDTEHWKFEPVPNADNDTFYIRALGRKGCDSLLSAGKSCEKGWNRLSVASEDDGSGLQHWIVSLVDDSKDDLYKTYHIRNKGRSDCDNFLALPPCNGNDQTVLMAYEDDDTGRQRWMLQPIGQSVSKLPLKPFVNKPLPVGDVKPSGWMLDQMKIEADGLAGHLYDFFSNVNDSPWLGGSSDYSDLIESGPYWVNGLIPLAYQLQDHRLIDQVETFMDYVIEHQEDNGWIGPSNSTLFWPRVLILHSLSQYAEGNPKVTDKAVNAMHKLLERIHDMLQDGKGEGWESFNRMRWFEMGVPIMWLMDNYPNGKEETLASILKSLRDQGDDLRNFFRDNQFPKEATDNYTTQLTHGVNNGMALKAHTIAYRFSHDDTDLDWARHQIKNVNKYHGRANGLFAADEHFAGLHASRGTELCTVVEMSYSYAYNYMVTGDGSMADFAEQIVYNGLPAEITEDMWAHQYLQQFNQITAKQQDPFIWTHDGDDSTMFGLEPNYPCCTVNHPQGYPKFVTNMFMTADNDSTILAALLGPGSVSTQLQGGVHVQVNATTMYPFSSEITYAIKADGACQFGFRVPGYASDSVSYKVNNDSSKSTEPNKNGIVKIAVDAGDTTVTVNIPMKTKIVERPNGAVAVQHGPSTYALPINYTSEIIHKYYKGSVDYAFTNSSRWEYAIDPTSIKYNGDATSVSSVPFATAHPPVTMTAQVCLTDWQLEKNSAAIPPKRANCIDKPHTVTLVPFGSTRMRIAEFPVMAK
ncbi:hypothetical protein LRAMOSA09431 [Lichtheimia ramosa]|uniref:Non-reducing end beta-L-arabinofuranosidase-like GH127 catalytic domain-containing protein n=1 Tax=Lichtheimia ramosa TaxID=688394 RepID=A0A077WIK8_9FUNG|nr:hypothetical protein LRAMOSA09431 [Lichtheimia ramosa]